MIISTPTTLFYQVLTICPHPQLCLVSFPSSPSFFLHLLFHLLLIYHISMNLCFPYSHDSALYWSRGHTALPIHIHKYVNDYFTLSMNTFRIFHLPSHALSTAVYVGAYTLTGWFSFSSYWSLIIFSC